MKKIITVLFTVFILAALVYIMTGCTQRIYPINYNTTNGIKDCNYPYPYKWRKPL